MDADSFGPLYHRKIPTDCRWCEGRLERIMIKKVSETRASFAFGCRICDQMFLWPRIATP